MPQAATRKLQAHRIFTNQLKSRTNNLAEKINAYGTTTHPLPSTTSGSNPTRM